MTSEFVTHVNDNTFDDFVKEHELVIVDLWAGWCQPCLMMAPVLNELSEELAGKLKICKLNTEIPGNQNLSIKYQIQSIPNMKLFKGGEVVKEFIGLRSKDAFKSELEPEL